MFLVGYDKETPCVRLVEDLWKSTQQAEATRLTPLMRHVLPGFECNCDARPVRRRHEAIDTYALRCAPIGPRGSKLGGNLLHAPMALRLHPRRQRQSGRELYPTVGRLLGR